jgi:hypothetical protein
MSLDNRVTKLEEVFAGDDGPSLAQRLQHALEEARERRRLGLPRPEPRWEDTDDPLAARMRQAHARAEWLRRQFAGGE